MSVHSTLGKDLFMLPLLSSQGPGPGSGKFPSSLRVSLSPSAKLQGLSQVTHSLNKPFNVSEPDPGLGTEDAAGKQDMAPVAVLPAAWWGDRW